MFWVVQDNIYKEQKHSVLMKTLEERNIPHAEVKVVPFFDFLMPPDFDSHSFQGDIDEVKQVQIDEDGPIMVLGSLSLARIAKERGWTPGSFLNGQFHYQHWSKAFSGHLLNENAVINTFDKIEPIWDEFFFRPCEDTKIFNGEVTTKEKFFLWREKEMNSPYGCDYANDEVMISPLKEIISEYRFFVVDGKVVTYSQYKQDNELYQSNDVPTNIVLFAQQMVDLWQPVRAFVIDIANTSEGLKVIEINNFNSAGFYDADVVKIIDAIEGMNY